MIKIGFIGTGNMAKALIRNIKNADNCCIIASDKNQDKLSKAEKELEISTTKSNKELAQESEIIFLCVKPKDIAAVLEEIREIAENKVIISIAAGVKISSIEKIIGNDRKVVRVMPNVNCIVGETAAAYSLNKNIRNKDKEIINKLLNSAGLALEINEEKMDAVTALSGSGPAFVAFLIDIFVNAGIKYGLSKEDSYKLAVQTFYGTGSLLKKKKITIEKLIEMVSSPGGTTVAGREVLEDSDINKIIDKTIEAAIKRSKELGKNG
ncbi:pyrroline-5-carboxylate reductase [Candidatus Woesearchaeota archaeon]|nr:pyrroline-5-carboxylate reductase [Candidatus Woesearchaeota archaeon]|tara:strand:+ start:4560 stop:5357 length:798 start_codon:yes stop_codon:yes gene_type:complete